MNLEATIAKMRAAGMTSEAILVALECIVTDDVTVTPEKSGAARRQAAYRERQKAKHNENHNVTHNVDNEVTGKKGFDKEIPHTPLEITSQKVTTKRATPKTRFPADWQPEATVWKLADSLGFTTSETFDQIERMRDWANGNGETKSDWNATLRNWLKRAADDRKSRPKANIQRPSIRDNFAIADAVIDEAIRREGLGADGGQEDFGGISRLRKSAA